MAWKWCVLPCLLLASVAAGATVDPGAVAVWGAATAADTLLYEVKQARWQEDAELHRRLRAEYWQRLPHDPGLLEEVVLWHRDSCDLAALEAAVAADELERVTGLAPLTAEDRLLLEGITLVYSGHLRTGRALLERLHEVRGPDAISLSAIYHAARFAADEKEQRERILMEALAHPGAAEDILRNCLLVEPARTATLPPAEARALILARPSRPHLTATLAAQAVLDSLRQTRLTPERFAALLDGFHAEHPAFCNAMLDDFFEAAGAWLPTVTLRALLEERADRFPPRCLAKTRIELLMPDYRLFDIYEVISASGHGLEFLPIPVAIAAAAEWHPDADEVERYARRLCREDLLGCWLQAERVLRDRDEAAAADSLRSLVAAEAPSALTWERLQKLGWADPTAAGALLDSLVAADGEGRYGWRLAYQAESSGDGDFVSGYRTRHGAYATVQILGGAIAGAQLRADKGRLVELADLIRELAPENERLLRDLASAHLELDDPDGARTLIEDLAGREVRDPGLSNLRINLALREHDYDRIEVQFGQYLADPRFPVAYLTGIPSFAARMGWNDLADQALARIEAAAAPGCRSATLLQADVQQARGSRDEARMTLVGLQASWPGSAEINARLVEIGSIVETYESPPGAAVAVSAIAGIEFDYDATAWIDTARARAGEFPDQDYLVLLSRDTYHLASRTKLDHRFRVTIEILSDFAVQRFETVRLPFEAGAEIPRLLCARTITPDGEVRDVPPSEVLVTAHQSDESDVSDLRDLVIPFAGLKPGTVIDYCIQTTDATIMDLGHSWTHRFGDIAPQREEVVEVVVAPGVEHRVYDVHEPVRREERSQGDATVYRWRLADQPPVHIEEMAPLGAVLPHWVGCTTDTSWEAFAQKYDKAFRQRITATESTRDLAQRLTADVDGDRERAEALFAYVRDEITNIGIELGLGRTVPTASDEVLSRGYGDCKDKVALLVALAAAVDLECLPVLVGTRPSLPLAEEFPCASSFDHMIACFTELADGIFADPTLGTGCLGDLPSTVAGQQGLLLHPGGDADLVAIPEIEPTVATVELTVDLYPQADGQLTAECLVVMHHETAYVVATLLDMPDTNVARAVVDMVAGNTFSESMVPVTWQREDLACGGLQLAATLRDSAWTGSDDNDAELVWNGVTDTEIEFPTETDRRLPVELDSACRYVLTLRAHASDRWRLSARHTPFKVTAPGFRGEVDVRTGETDDRRWLEVRREIEVERRVFSPADFQAVRDAYLHFRVAGFQPVRYVRQIDEKKLNQQRAYAQENPDDIAFAFQAALNLLGGDMGGDGEEGVGRRAVARELIDPILANPDAGVMPFLLAGNIALRDAKYGEADSLIALGLQQSPRDLYLLATALRIQEETKQDQAVVETMLRLQRLTGSEHLSYGLISKYLSLEMDDEATAQEERLSIVAAEVDSVALIGAKCTGYLQSDRADLATALLPAAERLFEPFGYQMLLEQIAVDEWRWDDAIAALQPVLDENPLNPLLNNNMAWYLACLGRDLDRAEYLVRMSIALSGEAAAANNTLGVVLLRQGKWQEADEIFVRLMEDERPDSKLCNIYFHGLCSWLVGKKEEALACWNGAKGILEQDEFAAVIRASLAAVDENRDPSWIFLVPPPGEQ